MSTQLLWKDISVIAGIVLLWTVYFVFGNEWSVRRTASAQSEPREVARQRSKSFEGTAFPRVKSRDAVSDQVRIPELEAPTLIVALSNSGCHRAQVPLLHRVWNTLEAHKSKISTAMIYYDEADLGRTSLRWQALLLRKASRARIPVWYTADSTYASFVDKGRLPMLFLVEEQKVISSHIPVSGDDPSTERYLKSITQHQEFYR